MRISIFCSSQEISIKYVAQVKGLVQLLVHNGHSIVWGGSNTGLMRVVADTVEKSGGQLTGISVSFLSHYARPSVKDMVIAQDLNERKQLLLDKPVQDLTYHIHFFNEERGNNPDYTLTSFPRAKT